MFTIHFIQYQGFNSEVRRLVESLSLLLSTIFFPSSLPGMSACVVPPCKWSTVYSALLMDYRWAGSPSELEDGRCSAKDLDEIKLAYVTLKDTCLLLHCIVYGKQDHLVSWHACHWWIRVRQAGRFSALQSILLFDLNRFCWLFWPHNCLTVISLIPKNVFILIKEILVWTSSTTTTKQWPQWHNYCTLKAVSVNFANLTIFSALVQKDSNQNIHSNIKYLPSKPLPWNPLPDHCREVGR